MQDWYALLREYIANTAGACLGLPLTASQIECPAGGELPDAAYYTQAPAAARSAAALARGEDAADWAAAWQRELPRLPAAAGGWRLQAVRHGGGHLLFVPDAALYTLAMRDVLASLPPATPRWEMEGTHTPMGRVRYAQHRMWMLARKATHTHAACPAYPAVQRALWRTLALAEQPARPLPTRALELRMQEAADALLTMAYREAPRNRPALLADCAHVADAAARLLGRGLDTIATTTTTGGY